MAYEHGVYTRMKDTSVVNPVEGYSALQVIVGTAPVNMVADPAKAVNTPILVNNYREAVEAVGYSDDFASYTLCEAIAANFQNVGVGPLVLINVLDPSKSGHQSNMTGGEITLSGGVAKVTEKGAILSTLVVNKGTTQTALTKDTDYTLAFEEDGTLDIIILDTTATSGMTSVTVSGKKLNPSAVVASDIVGSVDSTTGAESGIEVIRQVFPKYGLIPGILLAPRFSTNASVAAALQAKCEKLNGNFGCVAVIDLDSSSGGATKYSDVNTQKTAQGLSSADAYAVWLYGKIGNKLYSGSTLAAAIMAATDAANDDTPNVSPSNKNIAISASCLADGTEIFLDQDQANAVNERGIATFLNFQGFKLWGNETAAYPGSTDPKDRYISVRRFMKWAANTFILTYHSRLDNPGNPRLIESIVDSENIRGNGFVARDVCARYEIEYNPSENTMADLLEGRYIFHQYMTPYIPAKAITDIIEYDAAALAAALLG